MLVKYLGHSALLVQGESVRFIIDPFIIDNPHTNLKLQEIGHLDYIFVTHGHGDHLGDTVELSRITGATVVCNYELSCYLSRFDVKCHPMHIGGAFHFPFGRVKMTSALHGSAIETERGLESGGLACGFLIEVDSKKIYHAGDTGLSMEMQLLEDEKVEVAFLPIGGNFTMDLDDAVKACQFIKPNHVVPMHYDTFDLIKAEPEKMCERVEGYVDVVVMAPGEERNF